MERNKIFHKIAYGVFSLVVVILICGQTPIESSQLRRTTIKNDLDKTFSSMFTKLGISGEKLNVLKDLITDRKIAMQDFILSTMSPNFTEEEKIEMGQHIRSLNTEYEYKLGELLGEEAKSQFLAIQARTQEINLSNQFNELLSGTDKLTDKQQEELVESMYEARKNIEISYYKEKDNEKLLDHPLNISNEEDRVIVQDFNNRHLEGYLNSAKTILSTSQLKQFESYLNQKLQCCEDSLNQQTQMQGSTELQPSK